MLIGQVRLLFLWILLKNKHNRNKISDLLELKKKKTNERKSNIVSSLLLPKFIARLKVESGFI